MHIESEITIDKPAGEVFDFLAHAEHLPEYLTDFAWVKQTSGGEPAVGTGYSYKMARGAGEGTFEWTRFDPGSGLAWQGPAVRLGPGTMQPSGSWELSGAGDRTRVKFVMSPKPGGLFKLLAPFMAAGMRKSNAKALELLKQRLEERPAA